MDKLTLNSYAKLNLYLQVLNKRKDNYHSIKTLFERIGLSDTIILKSLPDKKIKIICNPSLIPEGHDNLAYQAAALLQESFSINKGVEIRIIKRIPVSAGLGGGSSNAAYVLLGLNKLWKLHLTSNKLLFFAKKIGSDVPFFIYNTHFAQGTNRGDKIKPLPALNRIRLWHVLVVPEIKVSTPLIYRKWDLLQEAGQVKRAVLTSLRRNVKILTSGIRQKDPALIGKALYNSLEEASLRLYPQISRLKEILCRLGVNAILMSGSGPAVFAIVSSRKEAVSLARQLRSRTKSWQVFVTQTC